MAEGYLIIKDVPAGLATAEADIKTKYTWSTITAGSKEFVPFKDRIILYAQGTV